MRILFVTSVYAPSVSGITVSIQNFKHELEARGHEVWVLAPYHPKYRETELRIVRYVSVRNPFARAYPLPLPLPTPRLIEFLLRTRFDIVHTQHPFYTGFFARLIAKLNRAPLIFTHHTRYDAPFVPILDNKAAAAMLPMAADRFCEQVDLVIAPSHYLETYLLQKRKNMNVVVIPSPVSEFRKEDAHHDPYGQRDSNIVRCVMVQRLTFEKKTDCALEAFAQLPAEYHLFIVGDGPARKKLEEQARTLAITDRVHILGFKTRTEVMNYLVHADVFVFTSTIETQSLSIAEAASQGLPMVIADSEFSRCVLPDGVCIMASLEPKLFAQAIVRAAENKHQWGRAARQWAQQFTIQSCTDRLEERYRICIQINQLNKTGWQSWSVSGFHAFPVPAHRVNPLGKDNYAVPAELWRHPERSESRPIAGWSSWGAYGTAVREEKIEEQVLWIEKHQDRIPLEYCLIDDGWTRWGDWCTPDQEKFPRGLAHTVRFIHDHGLKAGIWIAPFLASPKSRVAREFPSWFARDQAGSFVDGAQFHSFIDVPFLKPMVRRLLDIRVPEAWEWIRQSIDFLLRDCAFDLIKLDFLFAPYFTPDIGSQEASEIVQRVLHYIRETYPSVYVIGCGCPLVDGVGLVDAMRIGRDTVLPWLRDAGRAGTMVYRRVIREAEVGVRNRMWTSTFWTLDPDALVVPGTHPIAPGDATRMMRLIKDCRGVMFVGDDLTKCTEHDIHGYIEPVFK